MTGAVLAVWAAPAWTDAAGLEFLRIVTALVACGNEVRLVELGAGRGVLTGDGLPNEAERYLEGLARSQVAARAVDEAGIPRLFRDATAVIRVAPARRAGVPPVLELAASPADPSVFLDAGQVVRGLAAAGRRGRVS